MITHTCKGPPLVLCRLAICWYRVHELPEALSGFRLGHPWVLQFLLLKDSQSSDQCWISASASVCCSIVISDDNYSSHHSDCNRWPVKDPAPLLLAVLVGIFLVDSWGGVVAPGFPNLNFICNLMF